jgi:hypothetical protein
MRSFVLAVALLLLGASCRKTEKIKKKPPAVAASPRPMKKRAPALPSLPPRLPLTIVARAAAESAETAASWDAMAEAYEQELSMCDGDCAKIAYAVVIARRNAMQKADLQPPPGDEPVPLPSRAQAALDAMDQFAALYPDDPDAGGTRFLAANLLRRYRQPDALDRLETILREYRSEEFAEYAANILLEALLKQDRVAEVGALVDELLADTAFMAGKAELRQTLERIRTLIAQAGP